MHYAGDVCNLPIYMPN